MASLVVGLHACFFKKLDDRWPKILGKLEQLKGMLVTSQIEEAWAWELSTGELTCATRPSHREPESRPGTWSLPSPYGRRRCPCTKTPQASCSLPRIEKWA